MKIVVIDGTGLIGSKLVEKLRRDGHDPLAALPDARVVVDVSDATAPDLAAEAAARVAHHVMLSVVGGERLPEEEVVKGGPVPYTIVRATQLFERVGHIAGGNGLRLPGVLVQPVAADDVASTLADVATGSPLNDTIELAGPDVFRLEPGPDDRSLLPGDDARIAPTHLDGWLRQSSPNGRSRNVRR
jgi:uncharacterized protein YbjT (DUF2867 family)